MTRPDLRLVAAAAALVLGAAPAAAQPAPAPKVVAITGATVYVEPGQALEGATVILRDGKVAQVGKGVAVPAGARAIDARGKIVTAGLIDASTRLGLEEVGQVSNTVEGEHDGEKEIVHAAYRVTDGYNPRSVAIPITRSGGVTSAVSVPLGGLFSGTGAWFTLADGTTAGDTVAAPVAMYVALGNRALAEAGGSRGAAVERVREVLDDAQQYSRRRAAYERNQSRKLAAARLDLEALLPVLRGQIPLVVRVHRASDIRTALRLLGDFPRLRLIVEGGTEAWRTADELAKANVPVIYNPLSNLPRSFERIHVRNDAAKVLVDAGVKVALSTMHEAANVRTLRQIAGVSVAYGLTREQALAAVTTVPAEIFGAKDRGTLQRGSAADLVVWSGDPFEFSSRVEHMFIGGVEQSLESRQTRLLERYRHLPKPPRGDQNN